MPIFFFGGGGLVEEEISNCNLSELYNLKYVPCFCVVCNTGEAFCWLVCKLNH